MKCLAVACTLVSLTLASTPVGLADDAPPASIAPTLVSAAEELVDALAKEDFAKATANFDAAMMRTLPEPRLRALWQSLTQQAGSFRQRLQTRTEKQARFDVVYVTCEFREFVLEAKVAFNASGQVAGLFFAPPAKPASDT
ncbi:MAG TPA: DUF3887 domain-containing protein [Opitutaceae bacterium]